MLFSAFSRQNSGTILLKKPKNSPKPNFPSLRFLFSDKLLAGQFGIRSIPTIIAFKKGKEANRLSGALQLPQLLQWIKNI